MKNQENEKNFEIRAYSKAELALMYSPNSTTHAALQTLRRLISRCKELLRALRRIGYKNSNRRTFTRREVALIVKHIGEP